MSFNEIFSICLVDCCLTTKKRYFSYIKDENEIKKIKQQIRRTKWPCNGSTEEIQQPYINDENEFKIKKKTKKIRRKKWCWN